jgi:hypothetical protein
MYIYIGIQVYITTEIIFVAIIYEYQDKQYIESAYKTNIQSVVGHSDGAKHYLEERNKPQHHKIKYLWCQIQAQTDLAYS